MTLLLNVCICVVYDHVETLVCSCDLAKDVDWLRCLSPKLTRATSDHHSVLTTVVGFQH
jgi:hypothetical protein